VSNLEILDAETMMTLATVPLPVPGYLELMGFDPGSDLLYFLSDTNRGLLYIWPASELP
jgi:hypothetical protein